MSLKGILSPSDIAAALKDCQDPGSFKPKRFCEICGITKVSDSQLKEIFKVVDDDESGYAEEEELKFFLQRLDPGARVLTACETKDFMSAADHDGDGKIGSEEFIEMIRS
ncbi:hypothetical protein GDO86_017378 [Hymenochirus boettgeri]|uniref:Parvalbumin n=1 Tax=Hymenochirus boettgeri TaxID=247094 RepID=A0A8T2IMR1_9PIPI|nr:hypothetical protein GDO86_017378 [Hymenochirus boettgeri]